MVAKIAHVRLWGEEVGVLADTGMFTFEYVPNWLEKNVQIAPIHMPNSKRIFFFPGLNPETYKGEIYVG